jgi:predicted XRE-type DNA-binding protein
MKSKVTVAKTPEDLAELLGLGRVAAQDWEVQAALLKRLQDAVRTCGLTHAQVADRSGSSRTRITAILNGNLTHVSTDLLIRILGSLGYRVKVSVTKIKPAA